MRVTGHHLLAQASASTRSAQARVGQAAAQLGSGERLQAPSDDPTAWAIAARARAHASLSQGARAGVATSSERLEATDLALASLGDVFARARELTIEGATDSLSATDRGRIAIELRALFESAIGFANARAPDGEYLLAGAASQTPPFDPTGAYLGDAGAREVLASEGALQMVTVPGTVLTAVDGVDVLPALDRAATAFASNDVAQIALSLDELEQAVEQLASARTRAGGAMAVLRDVELARRAFEDRLAGIAADAVEADPVTAATAFAQAGQTLETTQAIAASIANLLRPG
ncbi:MAG: hypothetical protein R2939_03135 [Kofleriaceae bacterium]